MKVFDFGSDESNRSPMGFSLFVVFIVACLWVCSSASSDPVALASLAGSLVLAYLLVGPKKALLSEDALHEAMPQTRREWLGLVAVLGLGTFLRFYRLSSLPPGLFLDMGFDGWGSLRILRDGWLPGPEMNGPNPESTVLLYALAGWFSVVPATLLGNAAFFATVSVATLAIFFFIFRSLAGPRPAMVGLFFLAVMRWHFNYGRNAFPNSFSLFFLGVCLYLFLQILRTGGWQYFFLWGATLGGGLWTYQAFKVVPLWMAVIAFYEYRRSPFLFNRRIQKWLSALGVSLCLALPVLWTWFGRGSLGRRESAVSVLNKAGEPGFTLFLWNHALSYFLMFHRTGDPSPQHNIPYHPMLDPVTGFFLVIGVLVLFRHRWTRTSFYIATGICILVLPGLLSVDPAHASRVLAMTPWLALSSAFGFLFMWDHIGDGWNRDFKRAWGCILSIFMGLVLVLNFHQYFDQWASDPRVWKDHSVPETQAAQAVMKMGGKDQVRIAARFKNHFSFMFLAFDRLKDCVILEPDSFLQPPPAGSTSVRYVLEPSQDLYRRALRDAFPNSRETILRYPWGEPIVYLEEVSAEGWKSFVPDAKGLAANYYARGSEQTKLYLKRKDRFLDFSNGNDFPPLPPGLDGERWGDWKGNFQTREKETCFMILSSLDPVGVKVDGMGWHQCEGDARLELGLKPGKHEVEIRYPLRPIWGNHLKFQMTARVGGSPPREVSVEPGK
jgi:hypothetical protein